MRFSRSILAITVAVFAVLGVNNYAQADITLLNFAQNDKVDKFKLNLDVTKAFNTLTASNVDVKVTTQDINAPLGTFNADFNLYMKSDTIPVLDTNTGTYGEHFSGWFSITNGSTVYLSSVSIDGFLSQQLGKTSASFNLNSSIPFSSNFFPANDLQIPTGITGGFTSASKKAAIAAGNKAFVAAIFGGSGGTFSATAVPEPSSLALLGLGGIGLAIGAYRRRTTAV